MKLWWPSSRIEDPQEFFKSSLGNHSNLIRQNEELIRQGHNAFVMPAAMVLQLMGSLSQSEDDEDDDDDNNNTARVGAQPRDNDEEGSEEEGQQQNCAIS